MQAALRHVEYHSKRLSFLPRALPRCWPLSPLHVSCHLLQIKKQKKKQLKPQRHPDKRSVLGCFISTRAVTHAPYCLSVHTEVNVRLLSRSDAEASPAAVSSGDSLFLFVFFFPAGGNTWSSCRAAPLLACITCRNSLECICIN